MTTFESLVLRGLFILIQHVTQKPDEFDRHVAKSWLAEVDQEFRLRRELGR